MICIKNDLQLHRKVLNLDMVRHIFSDCTSLQPQSIEIPNSVTEPESLALKMLISRFSTATPKSTTKKRLEVKHLVAALVYNQ